MFSRKALTQDGLGHTEFQIYARKAENNIVDFTERRLIRCAVRCPDSASERAIKKLLADYLNGDVAVAWQSGTPIFVKVTRSG